MATNIVLHAEREFELLSAAMPDPNNRPVIEEFKTEILALVDKFGESGQSGGSAPFTAGAIVSALKNLFAWKPLGEGITGEESEWGESLCGDENVRQNRRLSAVFKDGDTGRAYYLDAISFVTPKGYTYHSNSVKLADGTRIGSTQFIKSFPFSPKNFQVDVDEHEVAPDDWELTVRDESQLTAVFAYYDLKRLDAIDR